jgi:hypothetical protein
VQLRTRSDVACNANAYQSERSGVFKEVNYRGSPVLRNGSQVQIWTKSE